MKVENRIIFNPDYSPRMPGEYLRIFLVARGIKIVDFARRTGRPTKTISEIISGKSSITPETALQFERVLGEGAGFWLALESKHQLALARSRESVAANKKEAVSWAKNFPISEMVKLHLFEQAPKPAELVDHIIRAFGVSSISAWDDHWKNRLDLSRFKQQNHNKTDPFSIAVWLRRAEMIAGSIETATYSESAFREKIPYLSALSTKPWKEISGDLIDTCSQVGVAIALVPSIPKTGLRGAAYWATKDKAVIVLSDRLKYEANIWFSFFHEACHILEHSKKSVFIDQDSRGTSDRDIEQEADEFSADTLIPKIVIQDFVSTYGSRAPRINPAAFRKFANEHGVAPGLLLMRLQHHDVIVRKTPLTKLKRRIEFDY